MRSLVFAFLLAVSFASVTPNCTPDQWEGSQTGITEYANYQSHGKIEDYMHVSYDYTNKRSSVFLQSLFQGSWSFHQIILLFNENNTEGHRYVKNLVTDECTVSKLENPFQRICIPDGSIFAGNFFLGLEGGFNVSAYYAFQYMQTSNLVFSHKDHEIIPVMETLSGRLGNYDVLQTFTFRDITLGIESDHVFDPPKNCSEDDEWLADAPHLTREQYFLAL